MHLPAIGRKLVSRHLSAFSFEDLLHISEVDICEGTLDIKLVRSEELHGPVHALLYGVHRTVALLEIELLRGEDLFHQPDEGRLTCVAVSMQPYETLLLVFSFKEDISTRVDNLTVSCLPDCGQTLLISHFNGMVVNEAIEGLSHGEHREVVLHEVPPSVLKLHELVMIFP